MKNIIVTTLSSTIVISFILAVLSFIFRKWLANHIEYSIKHEYDVQIEKLKDDLAIRSRAALVGELLAEWLSRPDERKQLNKLTFEAFLWLPDNIAQDLSQLLSLKPSAPSVRDVIVKVRNHLFGKKDGIQANDVIIFHKKDESE